MQSFTATELGTSVFRRARRVQYRGSAGLKHSTEAAI
jgi:hypothetical protein